MTVSESLAMLQLLGLTKVKVFPQLFFRHFDLKFHFLISLNFFVLSPPRKSAEFSPQTIKGDTGSRCNGLPIPAAPRGHRRVIVQVPRFGDFFRRDRAQRRCIRPRMRGFWQPPAALRAAAFAQSLPLRKGFFCFSRASCKFSRVLG